METNVELSLSRVSSSRSADVMRLRITDSRSRTCVLECDLTPEQFTDLLSTRQPGGHAGIPAWLPSEEVRARLGKYEAFVQAEWRTVYAHREDDTPAREWAQELCRLVGASHAGPPSQSNTGHTRVRLSVYLTDPELVGPWQEVARELLSTATPPWVTTDKETLT